MGTQISSGHCVCACVCAGLLRKTKQRRFLWVDLRMWTIDSFQLYNGLRSSLHIVWHIDCVTFLELITPKQQLNLHTTCICWVYQTYWIDTQQTFLDFFSANLISTFDHFSAEIGYVKLVVFMIYTFLCQFAFSILWFKHMFTI